MSQYSKSGSMFSLSEPVEAQWPTATAADSEMPCVCARLSDPHKQSRRAAPRAWLLILPSITEQPLERLPDHLQGLKLGLKLELCRLTNEL